MAKSSFHFPEGKLLRASAGSGKTYQLTKRYVQLLFLICRDDPASLKEVLAITFTNKAAQHMKFRILEFLKRTSLGVLQDWEHEDILKPVGLTAHAAAPIAMRLMDYILRQYHYFAVQTIDSFVNAMLAGCAFKIGLSAKFRIRRNAFDYLQLGLDELLLESTHDKNKRTLFDDFIKQHLLLDARSGWLPKEDLLKTMMILYRQAHTYGLPLKPSTGHYSDVWADKRKLYDILYSIHLHHPQGMHKKFANALANFIEKSAHGYDITEISDYLAREEFPVLKDVSVEEHILDQWNSARQLLEEICVQEAFGTFDAYIHIYQALMVSFSRLHAKDDVLFLEQLNQKARELFDHNVVTVSELYFRLASRFKHYLIDEFQDTNRTQWGNLKMMVEESLSSDGSLFLVADSKQAIYGFRGGDSGLFDVIAHDYKSLIDIQTLDTNRRSHQKIVEFNNHIFGPDNLKAFINAMRLQTEGNITSLDEHNIMHIFEGAEQKWRDDLSHGCVRVVNVYETSTEDENQAYIHLQECLQQVRQRFLLGDIAVLVRSNAQVELVTGWLMQQGVSVESERTSDILSHLLIEEIIALLHFLYNRNDHLSLSTFLLGDIAAKAFNISHDILADFCFKNRPGRSMSQAEGYLYKAFAQNYPEMCQHTFERFFKELRHYPLYELTISIYNILQIQQNFPEDLGFLIHFLEIIKIKEEDSVDGVHFLENFKHLEDEFRFIPLPKIDAVRVLTMHKAKGLEFPVVILPFLEMPLKVGSRGQEGGQSFSLLHQDDHLSLVRLKKKYTIFSPALKKLWDYEYNKSLLNEMCTIYVALTRAVLEMYIFIPQKSGNTINPIHLLIPPQFWQSGNPLDSVPQKYQHKTSFLEPLSLSHWMPLLREDVSGQFEDNQLMKLQGERWHFALAKISVVEEDKQYIVFAQQFLREAYECLGGSQEHIEEDMSQFQRFLMRPDIRPLFMPVASQQVYCEIDFVNQYGDLKRMDRLMIDAHKVIVIDYKSSSQRDEFNQIQMKDYVQILASYYPQHTIESRLIYFDGVAS